MRLVDIPVQDLSDSFGKLGLSLSHINGNVFRVLDLSAKTPVELGTVTTWELGEALGRGVSTDAAARKIVAKWRIESDVFAGKRKGLKPAPGTVPGTQTPVTPVPPAPRPTFPDKTSPPFDPPFDPDLDPEPETKSYPPKAGYVSAPGMKISGEPEGRDAGGS